MPVLNRANPGRATSLADGPQFLKIEDLSFLLTTNLSDFISSDDLGALQTPSRTAVSLALLTLRDAFLSRTPHHVSSPR